jgi:hypothetical protein
VGATLLALGVGWAYADRAARFSLPATALLGGGTVLALLAVLGMVAVERRADGLVLAAGERLPVPHWQVPVALAGLCDLAGGLWVSPALAGIGAGLLLVAAVALGLSATRPRPEPDRATVAAARAVLAFARRHRATDGPPGVAPAAGPVDATLEHLGRGAVRLVVVAADGAYADVVLDSVARAGTVARLATARVHPPDSRELAARVRVGGRDWRAMAGAGLRGRSRAASPRPSPRR